MSVGNNTFNHAPHDRKRPPWFAEMLCKHANRRLPQKMNTLRLEQEEAQAKVQDLQQKVKTLEQENLAKEQEITSLSHKNQLLETENEKLDHTIKEQKLLVEETSQHGAQNETLQRRMQLLEEEAEEADKNMRETNEKYVLLCPHTPHYIAES